jgi:hypothetical protein
MATQARHMALHLGAVNALQTRLCPAALLPTAARAEAGAGEGNRTLVVSLEGFCSTIELHPPGERADGGNAILGHAPSTQSQIHGAHGTSLLVLWLNACV